MLVRSDLEQLAAEIESIEQGAQFVGDRSDGGRIVNERSRELILHLSTSWSEVDSTLGGGLRRGAVHEWFALNEIDSTDFSGRRSWAKSGPWFPPLAIFIHLAWRAVEEPDWPFRRGGIVWIGERCRPNPRALIKRRHNPNVCHDERDRSLLMRSLLIDPPDDASRLWAIDLALRSSAVAMVIADGSRLDMAATRRLQLAAEAGGSIALLARPPHEMDELSAAATRWAVRPDFGFQISNGRSQTPRWIVQLLRCKGVRPAAQSATAQARWALEWNGVQGSVHAFADVVDRPGSPARSSSAQPPAVCARRSA
jgi:hypothetical protein